MRRDVHPCDFALEEAFARKGFTRIAGVDEAGRGPLAGPVVAATVIFPFGCTLPPLTDSKQLTDRQRRRLLPHILRSCLAARIGIVEPAEIDRINILQATFRAMRQALAGTDADAVIVDGLHTVPSCTLPQQALPRADGRSLSVAAASILAKVIRDDIMCELDTRFPGYGFAQHKGYAAPAHFEALDLLGPCPVHRESFLVRWRERRAQGEMFRGVEVVEDSMSP